MSKIICVTLFCLVSNWTGFIVLGKKWFSLTILKALFYCSSSQSVIPELAVSVSPGHLLKVHIFELHPDFTESDTLGVLGVTPYGLCLICAKHGCPAERSGVHWS